MEDLARRVIEKLVENKRLNRKAVARAEKDAAQKVSVSRAQLIPRSVAEECQLLPVGVEDGELMVVMADPANTFALERVAALTQLKCTPRATYAPDLPEAIEQAFAVKVEWITAETPHHSARPAQERSSGIKFVTATRQPISLEKSLRKSLVQTMGASRSVKIEGFVTASPADDGRVDTSEEKLSSWSGT